MRPRLQTPRLRDATAFTLAEQDETTRRHLETAHHSTATVITAFAGHRSRPATAANRAERRECCREPSAARTCNRHAGRWRTRCSRAPAWAPAHADAPARTSPLGARQPATGLLLTGREKSGFKRHSRRMGSRQSPAPRALNVSAAIPPTPRLPSRTRCQVHHVADWSVHGYRDRIDPGPKPCPDHSCSSAVQGGRTLTPRTGRRCGSLARRTGTAVQRTVATPAANSGPMGEKGHGGNGLA